MTDFAKAMVSYNANDTVSYNASSGTNTMCVDYSWYQAYWQPWVEEYHHYYPYTATYVRSEDTYKKAFNIAKLLLKDKVLVSNRLIDFVALVEKIAKEV